MGESAGTFGRAGLHDHNQGTGAALRSGFEHDVDLEYDPNEYGRMVEPILAGKADVVFGSRFAGGEPHRVLYFWHRVGNDFLTLMSNMFTNLDLTDMETCYKAFRREIIQSITIEENRVGFEPEITAKVAKREGIRIYEVGISYYGRTYEEGKNIGWKDGVRAFYCIMKYNTSLIDVAENLFVGSRSAVVDIGLFYFGAVLLHWNYLLVGLCSFTLPTLVDYANSASVASENGNGFSGRHERALVFVIGGGGLLLHQAILYVCVSQRMTGLMLAKLIATGCAFMWNHVLRSRFIFARATNFRA